MTSIGNGTGPRIHPSQKQISWWSQELAELRAASIRARRLYTRSRRGKRDDPKQSQLYEEYRKARLALSQAKWRAKYEHGLVPDKPEGHPFRMADKTDSQEGTIETSGSAADKPEDNSCQTEVNSSTSQVEAEQTS